MSGEIQTDEKRDNTEEWREVQTDEWCAIKSDECREVQTVE